MVSKDNIIFTSNMVSNIAMQIVWVNTGKSFILQKIILSNKQIAKNDNITKLYTKYTVGNQKNLISLRKLLKDAWLKEIIKKEDDTKIDFDFSNISKNDIIEIIKD